VPSIAARIDAGVGATPLGLEVPAAYRAVYGTAASAFGRARSMRCPHYVEDGGLCGIWEHRNATCSTWFCKHIRGAVGDRLWRAIGSFLHILEVELSLLCAERLGLDPGCVLDVEPSRPTAGELDATGEPDPGKHWGAWAGRERELYRACAELVAPMTLAEILAAIGPRARLAGRIAGARFADLRDTRVPERVTRARPDPPPRRRRAHHCVPALRSDRDPGRAGVGVVAVRRPAVARGRGRARLRARRGARPSARGLRGPARRG
jgi:hypothetical protein